MFNIELVELIESIDIVEYLSQFTDLQEKNGEFWGLSPLKDEHTPSFSVRRETKTFYDFASGVGGNVLTFTRFYYHCGYDEAIKKLKEYVGCDGTEFTPRKKLIITDVAKRYSPQKKSHKVESGIVLPDNHMEQYEKRNDKLEVWRKEGISDDSMSKFQVYYDAFSNRIVYPIRNPDGRIVNVGGRTLDPGWKDKGLRKYTYFYKWGELKTIYGLAENIESIKEQKEIILFEGCKSVLIADTWKIHNTGALLTSHLNPNQMKLLISLGCDVVFALDKEVDIRKDHNIQRLKQFVNISYFYDRKGLLDEKDAPVDKGIKVFQELYNTKVRLN